MKRTPRTTVIGSGIALALACLCVAPAAGAGRLRLRKPARGFQMRMTPFMIRSGGDKEGCEYRVVPNRKPLDISEFQLKATPGTHHFVVWQYIGPDRDPAHFWNGIAYSPGCTGLGPQSGAVNSNMFGMLSAGQSVRLPEGVAVRLEPNAVVYPNLHFHNYTDADVLGQAVFNFIPARKGTVRHHAQAFTVGSLQIDIPPLGDASLTGEWHAPVDLNMVSISTHQHRRGTGVSVHHIGASGADLGELVVSPNWEHPTVEWYQQALRIKAGDGLRFTCEWHNPDDVRVRFGATSEDEMCFVTGYFYLDDDDATVTGPGCIPQGRGLECFVPRVAQAQP